MSTAGTMENDQNEQGAHEHETPSYDDINTPVVVLVGMISALITLLIIMFVQGLAYQWQNSFLRERTSDAVSLPANQEIASQKAVLEGGNGITSIEESMNKVVQQYGKK